MVDVPVTVVVNVSVPVKVVVEVRVTDVVVVVPVVQLKPGSCAALTRSSHAPGAK